MPQHGMEYDDRWKAWQKDAQNDETKVRSSRKKLEKVVDIMKT